MFFSHMITGAKDLVLLEVFAGKSRIWTEFSSSLTRLHDQLNKFSISCNLNAYSKVNADTKRDLSSSRSSM